MIFVCVGSREYQFNRLLKEVDKLIEKGVIKDSVYAQIGQSSYFPKNYRYKKFMSLNEFNKWQKKSDLIISHGGTGALIGALKNNKQVLAVPRLEKYKEHIDNHQIQVSSVLESEGYLKCVIKIEDLGKEIIELNKNPIKKIYKKENKILGIIDDFIKKNESGNQR